MSQNFYIFQAWTAVDMFPTRNQMTINIFCRLVLHKICIKTLKIIFSKIAMSFKAYGSQLKNPDISGAIFTFCLSLSIIILNSQCVEGARDVRVL